MPLVCRWHNVNMSSYRGLLQTGKHWISLFFQILKTRTRYFSLISHWSSTILLFVFYFFQVHFGYLARVFLSFSPFVLFYLWNVFWFYILEHKTINYAQYGLYLPSNVKKKGLIIKKFMVCTMLECLSQGIFV